MKLQENHKELYKQKIKKLRKIGLCISDDSTIRMNINGCEDFLYVDLSAYDESFYIDKILEKVYNYAFQHGREAFRLELQKLLGFKS